MSVDTKSEPSETSDTDRREATAARVPFEGVVEVGGALGPSFEAQAVDVSAEGIHLRTAYLPELGQPLTCRIEIDHDVVLAAGEVVWRQEADKGGDFGLRFTELDAASEELLRKLVTSEPAFGGEVAGARVRLHIDGLGSPMRARVKGSAAEGLVVGSDLGFLQVGKELELEDARTGGKRSARIHRVGVEVNPDTHIPQLVVSLRYDVTDADAVVRVDTPEATAEDTPEPSVMDADAPRATLRGTAPPPSHAPPRETTPKKSTRLELAQDVEDDPFGPMRSGVGEVFHRASAKVGPALGKLATQARTTFGLLAAKTKRATSKGEAPPATRRTTAPPPAGALHASGRKVVRGEPVSAMDALEGEPHAGTAKRRIAVGSAVLVAGVIALAAVHKPAAGPQPVASPVIASANTAAAAAPAPASTPTPATSTLSPAAPALAPVPPEDPSPPPSPASDDSRTRARKPGHVTPFGNGAVAHANVLRLKMDGAIEKIEGATTPTGFNVVIPDRRSLEAAAPLAARDSRIAAIRVTNEASGAELAVSFKDGVPGYQVRARGDSLEILLASSGRHDDEAEAARPSKKKHAHR